MSSIKSTAAWKLAHRLKHSDVSRALRSAPQALKFHLSSPLNPILEVSGKMGMGAMLTQLITLIKHLEQSETQFGIRFTNSLYSDSKGEDWLPRYFDVKGILVGNGKPFRIENEWDSRLLGINGELSLAEASRIFHERVRFSHELDALLEEFVSEANMPTETLGVHFRGTDKAYEAAIVSQDEMLKAVTDAMDDGGFERIFLATDEPSFEKRMIEFFGEGRLISYRHPEMRSAGSGPIHFSKASGSAKSIDALLNIRLMALCPSIVRTASYMSGWAKVINPKQKVMMLNKLATSSHRFPDSEVAEMMLNSKGKFAI